MSKTPQPEDIRSSSWWAEGQARVNDQSVLQEFFHNLGIDLTIWEADNKDIYGACIYPKVRMNLFLGKHEDDYTYISGSYVKNMKETDRDDFMANIQKEIIRSEERLEELKLPKKLAPLHFIICASEIEYQVESYKYITELKNVLPLAIRESFFKENTTLQSILTLVEYDIPADFDISVEDAPKEWIELLFPKRIDKYLKPEDQWWDL